MTKAERIADERQRLHLRPWQLSPSEVNGGASPWPIGAVGADSWVQSQKWRAEIRARDPSYLPAE